MKAGQYDVAERYLLESVSKSKLIGNEILESWGYNGLTSLEMQRGNFNMAKKYCEQMNASDPLSEASKLCSTFVNLNAEEEIIPKERNELLKSLTNLRN